MSNGSDAAEGVTASSGERAAALVERAAAAGIEAEIRTLPGPGSDRPRTYVLLQLPNGRRTRRMVVFPRALSAVEAVVFEDYIILGDYEAMVHMPTGRIEALITGSGSAGRSVRPRALQNLPGVEVISDGEAESEGEAFEEDAAPTRAGLADNWRFVVREGAISLEFSPASKDFETLLSPGITVKIDGVSTASHDAAVGALEQYGAAMLFDLDLVYGYSLQLASQRRGVRRRTRDRTEQPPKFPRNHYAGQALELYQYGRAAEGLPLLEYLAYYQSVEYFFPFFAREQTVNSVRSQLLHPGFDAQDDAALNRLINLAAPAGRGGMAEREQLRATVRACMVESDVREFFELRDEYVDHFCSKSQSIKGVGVVHLSGSQSDLRDQIADRIYAIRCRIVHAKQDGGGNNEEVLLPASSEAASLQSDIELLRLVAQRALVARAARA